MKRLRLTCISAYAIAVAILLITTPSFSLSQGNGDTARSITEDLFENWRYRMIGPSRGGRVTAVTGHADQPHTFYMGATGGGVWKTTDAGASWNSLSDKTFQTGSIGSIDVADSDPNVIYVGTGSDGIRSNVIIGRGVYKSIDAGESWKFMGLRDTGQIGAIVVHPTNPEVVWVAALGSPFGPNPDRGVYKSVDGGVSWQHVLFVSEKTGAIDLELNPENPDEVYAVFWTAERKPWTIISGAETENGFYKSTDAGLTWDKKETGLPPGLTGKFDLAVSPNDPSRIYALVEAEPEREGIYRSNDRGESWTLVNNDGSLMTRPFYYTNVDADPSDADVVYVNNLGFHKSEDGGRTFQRMSTPHGDNHDMWINPDNPEIFIQSNDGGANVTLDGGRTWSTQHNQATAELYQIHTDDRFPYWVYAGQQDNSTIAVPSLPTGTRTGGATAFWEAIGGCETGPAVPRPGNANIVYSNCKGMFGRYNRATGQEQNYYVGAVNMYGRNPSELPYRFQRVVPIEVSPHNPDVIYHGSQYVHRTENEGRTWETISPDLTAFRPERQVVSGGPITRDITGEEHYSTLYVIEESPLEPGVIWTGANDGPVHVTRDGGASWTDVTPPAMPPEGRIQSIEVSPHQPGKVYIAGYRYLLNDFRPYIFRTNDYGKTWTHLTNGSNGIPDDYPTRVVREDPDREGLLYAGTDFGMFLSLDDGANWTSFQLNLPVTPVTDIKVYRRDLVLSTMGRSFWILDNLAPLHQLDHRLLTEDIALLQPTDAFRLRYRGGRSNSTDPEYPPAGVSIDYYLRASPSDGLTLEVLDTDGNVIRSYEQGVSSPAVPAGQGMRAPQRGSAGVPGPSIEPGLHRLIWDMYHEGIGGRGRGLMALPGRYTVRIRSGGFVQEKSFELLLDPRVEADNVSLEDLTEQFSFNTKMMRLMEDARELVGSIDSVRTALNKELANEDLSMGQKTNKESVLSSLNALFNELVTDNSDSYPPPMLLSQIQYLFGMTSSADQAPGGDAYTRFDDLSQQLTAIRTDFESLRDG